MSDACIIVHTLMTVADAGASLQNRQTKKVTYTDIDGSVAEWLACWTQAQKGLGSNRSSRVTVLGKVFIPSCLCPPSRKIGRNPLKGYEGNCRPGSLPPGL